jgi:hypothetical protein
MRLILVLLLAGCTTAETIRRPIPDRRLDALREEVSGKRVDATTSQNLRLTLDDARMSDGGIASGATQVPIEAIHRLEWRSHPRGALDGLLFGPLAGIALGIPIGYQQQSECYDRRGWLCGLAIPAMVTLGVLAGMVLGPVVGLAVGHGYDVTIE